MAEQLTGEGAVLLKNENGALPLPSGAAVSLFSHSSVDIATCGTGSADIDTSNAPTLKEALEAEGFSVNPTLWDFYATGAGAAYVRTPTKGMNGLTDNDRANYHVNEVPQSAYTDQVTASYADYNDAAIVVITRLGGELFDLPYDGFVDGTDSLSLTQEEKDMLTMVEENFDTVIVLINSTNAMSCAFLEEYGIDAALWIGYTGTWGLNAVAYPFGYGLSYTDFAWSDFTAAYDSASDAFTVNVTVTNTGNVAGKDVVEVYFQSPYTDYDRANQIEKAAVELCGFGKTGLLDPGASETVSVTVPREELAAYDRLGAKTYILDAGDYYLTAAADAHAAANNILAAKGYTTADGMTADGVAEMTWRYTNTQLDTTTYALSSTTGYPITNQFDNADLSYYGQEVTYLSRSDWQGTWPQPIAGLEATQEILDDLNLYQTYEGVEGSTAQMPTTGSARTTTTPTGTSCWISLPWRRWRR